MDTNILDGSTVFDPGRVKITGTRSAHSTPRFFHIQKFWEFIYIDKGFALLGGNGESVLLSEGDLAVVAPGENHSPWRNTFRKSEKFIYFLLKRRLIWPSERVVEIKMLENN